MRRVTLVLLIVSISIGCGKRIPVPEVQCRYREFRAGGDYNRVDNVDVLFVVDSAMATEHTSALEQAQVPQLVEALMTGDIDDDGELEFPPIMNLHVGIVSADLGSSGSQSPLCENVSSGDDGVMFRAGDASQKGCLDEYPAFMAAERYPYGFGTNPDELLNHLDCLRPLEPNPCAPPQPLEAALKALWPAQDNSISFFDNSSGHGDGLNRDFLRGTPYNSTEPDRLSLLAIILITNRDDRSLRVPCDFTEDSSCTGSLYPIERYALGLKKLRSSFTDLVGMAAIIGVPPEVVENKFSIHNDDSDFSPQEREDFYDALLTDPRMRETGNDDGTLDPICTSFEGLDATPSPRILQAAREFGANGAIGSVCSDDYRPILEELFRPNDGHSMCAGVCVPPLRIQRDGKVNCVLKETLPVDGPVTHCAQLADFGRDSEPIGRVDGREVCQIQQLAATDVDLPSGFGWFYQDSNSELARLCCKWFRRETAFIRRTDDTALFNGSTIDVVCDIPVGELFGPCDSDSDCAKGQFCEPINSQCVRACSSNSDCEQGYKCEGDSPAGSYCISAC